MTRKLAFALVAAAFVPAGALGQDSESAATESAAAESAEAQPAAAESTETPESVPVSVPADARPVVLDRLDLGTTSITGNQELPKVLYIVPWKRSDIGDLIGRPVNSLLDEVLAPVDPAVFERHLSYYETLHGETQED